MKRVVLPALAVLLSAAGVRAQSNEPSDSSYVEDLLLRSELDAVEVFGTWAKKEDPIAQINLTKKDIESVNTGRDLPYVLQDVAGVVSFSDAGNGVGYTNMRVRGSDVTRINVTVNGIPMNDAESHGVFWVNTPDLMSSTNAIQLQKGVGTSTNGSGAFGATLGLSTLGAGEKGGRITLGAGSFNTQRTTVEANTGRSAKGFWMNTRLSSITSDGYVERASSDLQSYYISGGYANDKHFVELVRFGGGERTYQAWWGIDSTTMYGGAWEAVPTANFAGAIYDDAWNVIGTYEDQVDNYQQEHTQLHYRMSDLFGGTFSAALHHTGGAGYFEEYNQGFAFADFALPSYLNGSDTISFGDVVTRKWLDNDFYGSTFSWNKTDGTQTYTIGGGAHRYQGQHFGRVIWANHPDVTTTAGNYYDGTGLKDEANLYGKWSLTKNKVLLYADAQYRYVAHTSSGGSAVGPASFSRTFHFFNPKAGATYELATNETLGAFIGIGHREPNRTDLTYASDPTEIKAERMLDAEFTYKKVTERWAIDVNVYRQQYQNQLVLTGAIDAQGYPIRSNVGQSFRQGIECAGTYNFAQGWSVKANAAWSQNQNVNWISDPLSSFVANTPIAFSPALVAGGRLNYERKGFELSIWNQFIGEQFMSNEGLKAHTLAAYHIVNARGSYELNSLGSERILAFVELRNLGNTSYAANGYMWGNTPYYYAQATFNIMTGLTFEF